MGAFFASRGQFLDGALGLLGFHEGQGQREARLPVAAVQLQDLIENPDGLVVLLFPDVQFCQAQPVAHALGVLLDQLPVDLPRLAGFVLNLAEQREIGEGRLEARLQGDGLLHPGRGILVELHLPVDLAEIVVPHDAFGVLLEEGFQDCYGFFVALRLGVDHAEVEIGVMIFRVQGDHAPVGPDGLFVVFLEEVDAPHEAVGFHLVGVVDEGLLTDGECPVELPHFHVERGQLRGEEGRLRVQGEGLLVLFGCLGVFAVQHESRAERIVIGGLSRGLPGPGVLCRCRGDRHGQGDEHDGQHDGVADFFFHGVLFLFLFPSAPFLREPCLLSTRAERGTNSIPRDWNLRDHFLQGGDRFRVRVPDQQKLVPLVAGLEEPLQVNPGPSPVLGIVDEKIPRCEPQGLLVGQLPGHRGVRRHAVHEIEAPRVAVRRKRPGAALAPP